jgi:Kef-type K+ transport system, predicted NAD-binding component
MELQLLNAIVLIFGISLIVGLLFNPLRIPPLVGFILTGIIVGPNGLGIVQSVEEVNILAEIGIVLLLFTIGLEFSFAHLWQIRKMLLVSGSIQVFLTFLVSFFIATLIGLPFAEAVLLGFLFALSSTAVVLRILHQRGEMSTPHGNIILGILIFQDIIAIPMIMAIPFLASISAPAAVQAFSMESLSSMLTIDILILVILVVAAKWGVPWFLYQIARTRNRELFLLFIMVTCFGVAWLVSLAGISLALGALLAGLLISRSEYSHQAIGSIVPFRDIFTSFFFVSVGMLLDVGFLLEHLGLVLLLIVGVIAAKGLIAAVVPVVLGYPIRTITLVGLALAQVGEFSFILSRSGLDYGILSPESYQLFLVTALITMAATPFVIGGGPMLSDRLRRVGFLHRTLDARRPIQEPQREHLREHVMIIGYGVTGRNLARAAKVGGIPYVIIEINPETVRKERALGEPIHYGDATTETVLVHADIESARIAVIAINDPVSTRQIVEACRRLNPSLYIIVRTRYLIEVAPLQDLGANEVVPEEFETSLEIFTRVLNKYLIPKDRIEGLTAEIRSDTYQMLRNPKEHPPTLTDLVYRLSNVSIVTYTVDPASPLAGKTLGEINLRKRHDVLVLAVLRGEQTITNPGGETEILPDDIVIVLGMPEPVARASALFQAPPREEGTPA